MIRRSAVLLLVFAFAAAACTYESSGTTTTTVVDPDDVVPATGPADILVEDQRIEGTTMTVASVTLPSDGWVVVREDAGGTPGEIIGMSSILRSGVVADVTVPFFLPLTEDTVVHASIHVDMDRDSAFTFEPPDSFVDQIATFANGSVASASATVELLPPVQPAEVVLPEQRIDGSVVTGGSAVLPAPGFVVLMSQVDGAPGEVLASTNLLPAGAVEGLEFVPTPPLRQSGVVFLVVWIDRDENGSFDPDLDAMGVRADGAIAQQEALLHVVPVEPAAVTATDQEGDGTSVLVSEVVLPATGFVELLLDADGAPGERLAIGAARIAGTHQDLVFELPDPLVEDTVLWVRVIIDFDEDGEPGEGDRVGLIEPDGAVAQVLFTYTIEGSA